MALMFASTMAATAGSIVMRAHPRSRVCARADAIGQRRTEQAFRDLSDGRRHGEPSFIDQKESGLGRNVHKTISANAIAPNAVVGLVLAKGGTQRYQLRHRSQPLAMLVITPIANGA
jgi:hypothetical protein